MDGSLQVMECFVEVLLVYPYFRDLKQGVSCQLVI